LSTSTEKIMNTIKWVNDTFVPWGMKPIEDLPEAIPGQGNSCVIARVLKDSFPELNSVQVGARTIDLNIFEDEVDTIKNPELQEFIRQVGVEHDQLEIPYEVTEFIQAFDRGDITELIDEEGTICEVGEWDAHDVFKIGCTHNEDCEFCHPKDGIGY